MVKLSLIRASQVLPNLERYSSFPGVSILVPSS